MGTNTGRFSSERQPKNRRGRGKSKRNQLLAAMENRGMTEESFWDNVLTLADEGEMSAVALVANRLFPAIKPSAELIPEGLLPGDWLELSRTSRLNYLIMLTVAGRVPVDTCVSLAKIMESASVVENVDQLDMILDGRLAVGTGDRKGIDRLKFAQDLSEKIAETIRSDRQRLEGLLTENEMTDTLTTEPITDTSTNSNEESSSE